MTEEEIKQPEGEVEAAQVHPLAIGVDIGGTSVKLGVVDCRTGRVMKERSFETPKGNSERMAREIAKQVGVATVDFPDIIAVGVGVPGAMNADRTLVRYPPNLEGWAEEPLGDHIRQALPWIEVVEVDNDAKVATLAEARIGAGKGVRSFLLATLGTGVGGGVFLEGSIYRGDSGGAGEFGHMSIDYNGPTCGCGQKGCIEAYLGQRHMARRALERLSKSKANSPLRAFLAAESDEMSPKDIADAATAGDEFARSIFEESGRLLGIAFANVAKLLDVTTFIVGGGVSQAGPVLIDAARASLREHVLPNQRELVKLKEAKLGVRAGVVGAAFLAYDTVLARRSEAIAS